MAIIFVKTPQKFKKKRFDKVDVVMLKSSYIAGTNVKWCSFCKKIFGGS